MLKIQQYQQNKVLGKFVDLHITMTIHLNKYNSISITGSKLKLKYAAHQLLKNLFADSTEFFFMINLHSLRPPNNPSQDPWRINFMLTNLNLLYPRNLPAKFCLTWLQIM